MAVALLGHLYPLARGHFHQHTVVGVVWPAGQSRRLLVRRRLRLAKRLAARRPVRQVQGRHRLCLFVGAALARVRPHRHLLGAQARPSRPGRHRPPPRLAPQPRLSKDTLPCNLTCTGKSCHARQLAACNCRGLYGGDELNTGGGYDLEREREVWRATCRWTRRDNGNETPNGKCSTGSTSLSLKPVS
ncbi:hypothetical protein TOPH_05708 [Tolypocladium ophioglossoides CBS 100239]|uniref:Uncharacterized protein n=1 Tax=Tolypocladium ophioglossoides (strain CBS 100239) TaxID=1163406 RepID=A0A0L0N6S3_TOLOC|nr:hypothetical protein TOPH_05708 [Tolypocladium ophioglossoides CBS 100239]